MQVFSNVFVRNIALLHPQMKYTLFLKNAECQPLEKYGRGSSKDIFDLTTRNDRIYSHLLFL